MTAISASEVKELRERTGAGMMDCKRALAETEGEMEAAIDLLRTRGLAAAARKAGRVAAEGLVGLAIEGKRGALVEVNSETDFVARNEMFQSLVRALAHLALRYEGDVDAIAEAEFPDTSRTVAEEISHRIATIGENITLRRAAFVTVEHGTLSGYVHAALAPGLGRIGVLVGLESSGAQETLAGLGKQLAMHVAAANPQAVDIAGLDAAMVKRERALLAEEARQSGKPEGIVEKMVEGRLRKFYADVALLEQVFVIDNETKVAKVIEAAAADLGASIEITGFARFARGDGIAQQ